MTRLATALGELFFPAVCAHCDSAYGEDGFGGLCESCGRAWLPVPRASCPLCARPRSASPGAVPPAGSPPPRNGPPCRACRRAPPAWRRLTILGSYEGPLASLIRAGKIAGTHSVLDRIAPPLLARLAEADPGISYDAVVAVPSDHRFVGILADRLAARLNAERPNPLFRVPGALRQVGLRRSERRANARRAISRRDAPVPQAILVIDDIMTTGATLHIAASLLREAGALIVDAVAIARAPRPGEPGVILAV